MTTFSKDKGRDKGLPVSTAHQSRLRLFQATRRPKSIEEIIETSWGKMRIKGRLGQQHADILEAILSTHEKHAKMQDGRIKILIDPYQIMKVSNQTSWSTFKKNLDDLMQALIEIKEPDNLRCLGHLIDHIDIAVKKDGTAITKNNPLGGVREMWKVEIGKAGTMLIENDLRLFYKTELIAGLRHGISQAIARHVLTHKTQPTGGWLLDTLITQACGDLTESQIWNRRRELRSDATELKNLGVCLSDDGERIKIL